jgi:hypothetical protein
MSEVAKLFEDMEEMSMNAEATLSRSTPSSKKSACRALMSNRKQKINLYRRNRLVPRITANGDCGDGGLLLTSSPDESYLVVGDKRTWKLLAQSSGRRSWQ